MWADANIVKLVFVVNDAETEAHLRKNAAAWSRLATPIVVQDLCRDEALAFLGQPYLMEHDQLAARAAGDRDGPASHPGRSPVSPIAVRRRSTSARTGKAMDSELAGRIVELVGGRILQLIAMKRDWCQGVSFDDSADELKSREREKLLQVITISNVSMTSLRSLFSSFRISASRFFFKMWGKN